MEKQTMTREHILNYSVPDLFSLLTFSTENLLWINFLLININKVGMV